MLSLRDPEGYVFERDGRILRLVHPEAVPRIRNLLAARSFTALCDEGAVVSSRVAETPSREPQSPAGMLLEHERIAFPSYPAEWHPAMLADAARLTLDCALKVADDRLTFKDATPFNVLFRGCRPVLVDILSIDARPPGYPYWLAEAQYLRTFALPLMASARGLGLDEIFLASREGLEPARVRTLCRYRDVLRADYWLYVRLPLMVGRGDPGARVGAAYDKRTSANEPRADFVYRTTLRRHRSILERLTPSPAVSHWSGYASDRAHYDEQALVRKRALIQQELERTRGGKLLDIGANTGEFSEIAAATHSVVAVEADQASVGEIYRRARAGNLDILPLRVNFASPTPGTGWENRETRPFIERARKAFDCVLMLAVIHHLRIGAGIPVRSLLAQAAEITRSRLIIENVAPADPKCQGLLRGRAFLAGDLQPAVFEAALEERFVVERREVLTATRTLYACRPRQ